MSADRIVMPGLTAALLQPGRNALSEEGAGGDPAAFLNALLGRIQSLTPAETPSAGKGTGDAVPQSAGENGLPSDDWQQVYAFLQTLAGPDADILGSLSVNGQISHSGIDKVIEPQSSEAGPEDAEISPAVAEQMLAWIAAYLPDRTTLPREESGVPATELFSGEQAGFSGRSPPGKAEVTPAAAAAAPGEARVNTSPAPGVSFANLSSPTDARVEVADDRTVPQLFTFSPELSETDRPGSAPPQADNSAIRPGNDPGNAIPAANPAQTAAVGAHPGQDVRLIEAVPAEHFPPNQQPPQVQEQLHAEEGISVKSGVAVAESPPSLPGRARPGPFPLTTAAFGEEAPSDTGESPRTTVTVNFSGVFTETPRMAEVGSARPPSRATENAASPASPFEEAAMTAVTAAKDDGAKLSAAAPETDQPRLPAAELRAADGRIQASRLPNESAEPSETRTLAETGSGIRAHVSATPSTPGPSAVDAGLDGLLARRVLAHLREADRSAVTSGVSGPADKAALPADAKDADGLSEMYAASAEPGVTEQPAQEFGRRAAETVPVNAYAQMHAVPDPGSERESPALFRAQGQDLARPMQDPAWREDLGERVLWMNERNLHSAEFRLNPAHLGPLEVRIRMDQDQQASVTFSAPHAAVREAIEAAVPRLREMLGAQQITLSDFSVVAPPQSAATDAGTFAFQQQSRFAQGQRSDFVQTHPGDEGPGADADTGHSSRSSSTGSLNLYA